jgi:antitoxin component of MazEF toxin-antitoxin module
MISETKIKAVGTSMGIIIPREVINEMDLKLDECVFVDIRKKNNILKDMFGRGITKGKLKENTLKELRKELEGKWL